MVDQDPLANQPVATTSDVDPLAGWTPAASIPLPAASPPKSVLATSYLRLPSREGPGATHDALGPVTDVAPIRNAFGEGYSSLPESVTRPGQRSIFTPEAQTSMRNGVWGGWPGAAANVVGDTLGTVLGGIAGVGNSAWTLGNETLRKVLPENASRDLALMTTMMPFHSELTGPVPSQRQYDNAATFREMSQPPAPTLPELMQRQRAAPTTDPTTAATIDLLRTRTQPTAMPTPPTPFAPSQQPPVAPAVSPTVAPLAGGLLNVQPGGAPIMSAEEMLAQSKAGYAPADRAVAQGATINPAAADKLRGVLVDAVPDDPQTAIGKGNTPLIQLGQQYKPFQGQPMTYDAAMTLDKRLTTEKNAAASTPGGATLATDIGKAQDAFRDQLENLGEGDTSGDASTLANLPDARKAFLQYRKQSQLDDIQYNASLLPDDKQNAYKRSQITSMLRNDNKMRGWSDDERAALETQLKSGNIGSLTNFGLGLFKPAGKVAGGLLGSPLGVGGTVVGGEIGGELGATAAARLRANLSKLQLDPVSQALTANMPPPPAGWTTTSRP